MGTNGLRSTKGLYASYGTTIASSSSPPRMEQGALHNWGRSNISNLSRGAAMRAVNGALH